MEKKTFEEKLGIMILFSKGIEPDCCSGIRIQYVGLFNPVVVIVSTIHM